MDEVTRAFAPGIYFDLDEAAYHADPALGSGDVRALLRSAPDYWWGSAMNPQRPKDDNADTPSRLRGRGIHKIVLEGEKQFTRLYKRRSDDPVDASPADKSATTKAEKKLAAAAGKDLLKGDDFDRAMITGAMISKNPEFATAFHGGVSEVSIFWNHELPRADGSNDRRRVIPCKMRADYLRPRGIADLKSITNIRGVDFVQACRNAIANYRYDIQAAHYLEGRAQFRALVNAGSVYDRNGETAIGPLVGEAKEGRDTFIKWVQSVANAREFAWVWVFFQAEDAPITHGWSLSPANPIVEVAMRDRDKAFRRYADFTERYEQEMWIATEPLAELDINEMPTWWAR